jgi:hypothetical protein
MNILFCSEGFTIDGVASYNLYLSAALRQAGHQVAIVGRWAGFKGFQERHRQAGIMVIQCASITIDNAWFVKQARAFKPDVIITDSRRSFPLALRIYEATGVKVVTVFHDPPQLERKGERNIENIMANSHVWVTSERKIYHELKKIAVDLPVHGIQRPITAMCCPTPLPRRDPFHIVCLGRLSRWKSPGLRAIVEKAADLKQAIPSLMITVVGGGRRQVNFWIHAMKANIHMKERFVRIVGTQANPQPFLEQATVVCAGATAAIEAILSERPVVALSGFWMGEVTPENLEQGVATHFAERSGEFYMRDNPYVVIDALINLYHRWDNGKMAEQTNKLRRQLAQDFDSQSIANNFEDMLRTI